ncbi:MAG: glycine zipper 2TM domain-containing protein, partial [Pseudomonadota bacterium]
PVDPAHQLGGHFGLCHRHSGAVLLRTGRRKAAPKPGAVLAGGILGAIAGRQFGSGNGREAATVAGALIGSAVASEKSSRRHGYESNGRPIKQCDITYETHQEERIDGYWVTYEYQGQRYRTRMSDHPGESIEVSVTVRPTR